MKRLAGGTSRKGSQKSTSKKSSIKSITQNGSQKGSVKASLSAKLEYKRSNRSELKKGLSPPKAFDLIKINEAPQEVKPTSLSASLLPADEFDKTQWENTKWKDSHQRAIDQEESKSLQGPAEAVTAGAVPGEKHQRERVRGQYLRVIAWVSIILLIAELCLLLLWAAISYGLVYTCPDPHGLVLNSCNIVLMLVSIGFLLITIIARCHVRRRTHGEQKVYYISYWWKIVFFSFQWLRVCLGFLIVMQHGLQWHLIPKPNPVVFIRLGLVILLVCLQLILSIVLTVCTSCCRFTIIKPHDE
ncbi:unnamed protein product, partial [Mesorhabditis belari]|uniref:Uncharacterized protein n=1 Tax=Mesorhabditis belari TaxID=2138241 RepID=A0AAF3FCM2_9BILA